MPDTMYPGPVGTLAATILAATPAQQRVMWSNQARSNAVTQNPFRAHRGGPQNLIEVRNDAKMGKQGDTVNFATNNEYFNEGIHGDTAFKEEADYEKDEISNDLVKVGLVKNGTSRSAYNEQTLPTEILGNVPGKLGKWMGRKEYEDAAMTHLHTAHATSRLFAYGNSAEDLRSADEFSMDHVIRMKGIMAPLGGTPIKMKTDSKGGVAMGFHVLATTPSYSALKADPVVQNMNMNAAGRGEANPVFTGELYELDGNLIQHFSPVDHTQAGPVGSPYAPRAYLGGAIATGTTAVAITGGRTAANAAKTKAKYYRWFPRLSGDSASLYRFANYNTLAAGADIWGYGTSYFYVTIVNPNNAAVDPGKWAIYKITANDGNQLTMSERLSTVGNNGVGIGLSTVGNVTYNADVHALSHPLNALVYLSNSYGLPLCVTPMFGASAMRMGMGIWDNYRHQDPKVQGIYDYLYIYSVFGHACTKDFGGQTPGILNLVHTYKMDGWAMPTR